MYHFIIILSLIAALLQQSDGYSSGAPPEACSSLQPNHGATPQPAETNPYELAIEAFFAPSGVYQYVPGVTYKGNGIKKIECSMQLNVFHDTHSDTTSKQFQFSEFQRLPNSGKKGRVS